MFNLELYCVDQSPDDQTCGDPCSFHILSEECRHENIGGRPQSQPVGQARHHQGGEGQHGQDRVGEAQSHHHHGQGGHQEEHGRDVPTVKPGLQQWRQQVSNCDGRLRIIILNNLLTWE